MNEKLQAILRMSGENLVKLGTDAEDKILAAWNQAEQDAQENDTKPKFRLGFTVTLDIDADRMESSLSFSTRCKYSVGEVIPDPNQTALDLDDPPRVKAGE